MFKKSKKTAPQTPKELTPTVYEPVQRYQYDYAMEVLERAIGSGQLTVNGYRTPLILGVGIMSFDRHNYPTSSVVDYGLGSTERPLVFVGIKSIKELEFKTAEMLEEEQNIILNNKIESLKADIAKQVKELEETSKKLGLTK
jgi:hypothetical protein